MMTRFDTWAQLHEIAFIALVFVPVLVLVFVDALRKEMRR